MASNVSAGVLLYRIVPDGFEVLIAHPGGPFWAKRDDGAWSIPKGLVEEDEEPAAAARREFVEEIGVDPGEDLVPLGTITQKSGKVVHGWGAPGDFDPNQLESELIEVEYPRGSGRIIRFPEIDRVIWAPPDVAKRKLNPAQRTFVVRLEHELGS